MSYNPSTGFTQVLADNIWQANGVAVSQDETFVVVSSTGSTRLYRYWLKGSKVNLNCVYCTCRLQLTFWFTHICA
jgi:sugar lactone lactonase YvrE